jgi:hypothetical protein
LTVACTLIVPVTVLAPAAVLAASCTALSALADDAAALPDDAAALPADAAALPADAAALPAEVAVPLALGVEAELAPQPAMAAAATAASPATCHGRRTKPALIANLQSLTRMELCSALCRFCSFPLSRQLTGSPGFSGAAAVPRGSGVMR